MTAQTLLLREDEKQAVYRVVLSAPSRGKNAAPVEYALEFSVTAQGGLGFDNRQPNARLCVSPAVSRLLAEEMARTAQARVPGALAGRSRKGLARELRLHRRAYALGVKRSHAVTAELGSLAPEAPDHDHNAVWFEHPFRSLPAIVKALFRP